MKNSEAYQFGVSAYLNGLISLFDDGNVMAHLKANPLAWDQNIKYLEEWKRGWQHEMELNPVRLNKKL